MNNIKKTSFYTFLILLLWTNAPKLQAAIIGSTGKVTSVRIESEMAFIAISQNFPSTCDAWRVWSGVTSSADKAILAVALSAVATNQTVIIRTVEEWPRVFGACKIYDIVILSN